MEYTPKYLKPLRSLYISHITILRPFIRLTNIYLYSICNPVYASFIYFYTFLYSTILHFPYYRRPKAKNAEFHQKKLSLKNNLK